MIKRIIIQRSLRSKSLQKITVENPYEIGLLLAAPPPKQGDRGGLSQLIAQKWFLVLILRSVATTPLFKNTFDYFQFSRDFSEDMQRICHVGMVCKSSHKIRLKMVIRKIMVASLKISTENLGLKSLRNRLIAHGSRLFPLNRGTEGVFSLLIVLPPKHGFCLAKTRHEYLKNSSGIP